VSTQPGVMTLCVWRHPPPIGAPGRCVGRIDLPVDRRKAKRLAHAIRTRARRERLPRRVVTSTAWRTRCVGRILRGWGWQHTVDARLDELDFGRWDGLRWSDISAAAVQAWCDDFAMHAVGGGESVEALLARCLGWWREQRGLPVGERAACMVGHGGWISAARWLQAHRGEPPDAARWPAAPAYSEFVRLDAPADERTDGPRIRRGAGPAASAS